MKPNNGAQVLYFLRFQQKKSFEIHKTVIQSWATEKKQVAPFLYCLVYIHCRQRNVRLHRCLLFDIGVKVDTDVMASITCRLP